MIEKLERFNERQRKIEEGIFPSGEITLLDIKDSNNERKMMTLAYVIRQLALDGRKIQLVCRDTPFPVAWDWLNDIAPDWDGKIMKNFLSTILNADCETAVVTDFDITDLEIKNDFQEIISVIRDKRLSFICTKDCQSIHTREDYAFNGWYSGIVTFKKTDMNVFVRPNLITGNSIEVAPFKWCEYKDGGISFSDLASLKFKEDEQAEKFCLQMKEG